MACGEGLTVTGSQERVYDLLFLCEAIYIYCSYNINISRKNCRLVSLIYIATVATVHRT